MINTEKTEIVQKQVSEWLNDKYFSHYLVVDLPFNRKHYGFEQATEYLKIIVKRLDMLNIFHIFVSKLKHQLWQL